MRSWPPSKKTLAVTTVVSLALAGVAAIVYRETRPPEKERHAILNEARELEKAIRSHDQRIWMRVEGQHPEPGPRGSEEAAHTQMLADFDRLGHLDDFRMDKLSVELQGDVALVTYAIVGTSRPGGPAAPARGELHLRRHASGRLVPVRHRLYEAETR